jgi:hypothetical protein
MGSGGSLVRRPGGQNSCDQRDHGAAVSSGQAVEVIGAVVALIAGVLAARAAYRAVA